VHVPKPVADAPRGLVTGVLLLAAVGLLIAALSTGHVALAWGSVAISAVAAALILRRWRRSWLTRRDAPEDELDLLVEDESDAAELAGQHLEPGPTAAGRDGDPGSALAASTVASGDSPIGDAAPGEEQPGEEQTDAADLLVVYELTDEVLVVDEHPRYHLTRCRWPDQAQAERLPVREARELGFTPCDRCRPDTTLARKHRGVRAASTGIG
jgi:hypothetical protein